MEIFFWKLFKNLNTVPVVLVTSEAQLETCGLESWRVFQQIGGERFQPQSKRLWGIQPQPRHQCWTLELSQLQQKFVLVFCLGKGSDILWEMVLPIFWETSRNKLRKLSVTKYCSDLFLMIINAIVWKNNFPPSMGQN